MPRITPSRNADPFFTLRVLWLALFLAGLNYVGIAYLNLGKPDILEAWHLFAVGPNDRVFILIGAGVIVFSHFLPKLILSYAQRPESARSTVYIYFIVKWALLQACSAVGFASAMIHQDFSRILPFVTAGSLGLLLALPTKTHIQGLVSLLEQKKTS